MRRSRSLYLQVASVDIVEDQVYLFVFRLDATCNVLEGRDHYPEISTPSILWKVSAPTTARTKNAGKMWAYWAEAPSLFTSFYIPSTRFDLGKISIIDCCFVGMSDSVAFFLPSDDGVHKGSSGYRLFPEANIINILVQSSCLQYLSLIFWLYHVTES